MRDYAELVKALRYCSDISDFRGCLECVYEHKCREHSRDRACINQPLVMVDAADAIEELLAAVPKWNPASKPPKENGRYYVAYEDSVSFLDYFNGKWFFPPRNGIVVEETKESILYWQPFPAPPKEDAE